MRISVITNDQPGTDTGSEHGFSCFIEFDHKRILFDTGQSNLFLINAGIIGLDISNPDAIILSHGHFDHGNGLAYLSGGKLICHPDCLVKRYRRNDLSYIGLNYTKKELSRKFNIIGSSDPCFVSDRIVFLGEIPRLTDFESKTTTFVFGNNRPDFVKDDSALALIHDEGIFIVTGCGHAGIVNTLEYAIKVTGAKSILGVIGGYHLKEYDLQTQETIKYLKKKSVKHVLPCHCTTGAALEAFRTMFLSPEVRSGSIFEL